MGNFADNAAGLVEAVARLGSVLATGVESRVGRMRAAIRAEVRRAASALALAILAALLGFATLAFGAVAILIAAWDTHPVLAASLVALGFGMLAIVALLLMRSNTR
jgi:predicted RND superfamily exporter protein